MNHIVLVKFSFISWKISTMMKTVFDFCYLSCLYPPFIKVRQFLVLNGFLPYKISASDSCHRQRQKFKHQVFYDYGKYRYNIFGLSNKKTPHLKLCSLQQTPCTTRCSIHSTFLGAWGSFKHYVLTSGVVLHDLSKCKFMQL